MIVKGFLVFVCFLSLQGSLFAESLFKVDFSNAPDGDAKRWLNLSNFALQEDARKMKELRIQDGKLLMGIMPGQLGGMALRRDVPGATHVKVVWGVNQYPQGANWDKGVKREAVMMAVAFGKQLQDSDAWLLPKIPYFIGVFLGEKEDPKVWRKGKYYTKGGAYICRPCGSKPGTLVTTELELPHNFKARFGKKMPDVIGFGFEFDTRDTTGVSEVVIQSVEFFGE